MARRDWRNLSSGYRQRLIKGGVSRQDYERGISLSAARGHGKTPERPGRATANPERFGDYIGRRRAQTDSALFTSSGDLSDLRRQAIRHGDAFETWLGETYGTSSKSYQDFNRNAYVERIQRITDRDALRRLIDTPYSEWQSAASDPDYRYGGVYYDAKQNPFHYHGNDYRSV